MPLAIIENALATQEPMDPQALADIGAWVVSNKPDANFALECRAESLRNMADIDLQADAAIARINARRLQLKDKEQRRADYFGGRIAEWAEANKESLLTGKKKSIDFIAGRVGWRKKGGKLRVENHDALVEWLATQDPKFYRVKLSPVMAELQAQVDKDGILPPGTLYEESRDELYIDVIDAPALDASPTKELP